MAYILMLMTMTIQVTSELGFGSSSSYHFDPLATVLYQRYNIHFVHLNIQPQMLHQKGIAMFFQISNHMHPADLQQ